MSSEAPVRLSDRAAVETRALIDALHRPGPPLGLRIRLVPGSCTGFAHALEVTHERPGNAVIESGGVRLLLDRWSQLWLRGATVDFEDTAHGRGFRVRSADPLHTGPCGCGRPES